MLFNSSSPYKSEATGGLSVTVRTGTNTWGHPEGIVGVLDATFILSLLCAGMSRPLSGADGKSIVVRHAG